LTATADTWQPLGKLDDLEVGEKKEVTLPSGKLVLLMRAEDGIYACCADCPHQETPLVEGSLDGDVLMCPTHFWQWNIKTGGQIGIAELPLEIFELREESGDWFIRT
jgi:toluene monooxygenase system ferredoxin subunit